jgi:predicted transcriptional regulator
LDFLILTHFRTHCRETKGRPIKVCDIAKSIREVMDMVEKEKKKAANDQIALVKK